MISRKNRLNKEEIARAEKMLIEIMQNTELLYTYEGKERLNKYLHLFVGAKCYEIQLANGMSNKEMAALIKKSVRTWIGIVSGDRGFKLEELIIIANRFNVGLDYFLKGFAEGEDVEEIAGREYCDRILLNTADEIRSNRFQMAGTMSILVLMKSCIELLMHRFVNK